MKYFSTLYPVFSMTVNRAPLGDPTIPAVKSSAPPTATGVWKITKATAPPSPTKTGDKNGKEAEDGTNQPPTDGQGSSARKGVTLTRLDEHAEKFLAEC